MPTTALQMTNRVLRLGGEGDVSAFSSGQGNSSQAVLDIINRSAREILESHEWPFRKRWAEITTLPSITGSTASVTNGSAAFGLSGVTSVTAVTGEHIARLAITDDPTYPGTSFQIVSGLVAGNFGGALATAWPGTTDAGTAAYRVFAAEYLLPDTVDSVYQVLYDEQPITLTFTDEHEIRSGYPRLWDDLGEPELVAVGGTGVATYDSSSLSTAPSAKKRFVVFPVPDARYVLRYQYSIKYAEMTATTDTLDGVPEAVIDKIVEMAFAKADLSNIFNNTNRGVANLNAVGGAASRLQSNINPDKGRRTPVRSLDSFRGSETNFGRLPDDTFGQP